MHCLTVDRFSGFANIFPKRCLQPHKYNMLFVDFCWVDSAERINVGKKGADLIPDNHFAAILSNISAEVSVNAVIRFATNKQNIKITFELLK